MDISWHKLLRLGILMCHYIRLENRCKALCDLLPLPFPALWVKMAKIKSDVPVVLMGKTTLHTLWAAFYILCACLGFIQERSPSLQALLSCIALLFFLPPAVLLYQAGRKKDKKELTLLRNLSAASLGLTLLGLVLAIATAPRATAEFFNLVLALVSAPMYCGNIWALSILLWACLFLASAEVGHHCK